MHSCMDKYFLDCVVVKVIYDSYLDHMPIMCIILFLLFWEGTKDLYTTLLRDMYYYQLSKEWLKFSFMREEQNLIASWFIYDYFLP